MSAAGVERLSFGTREEWLAERGRGIGASESAAACGISPFMTNFDLFMEKTGKTPPPDLSGNAAVEFGKRAEDPLRQLFLAKHPEYTLEYHPYDMLYQAERPWLFATLDGELITEDGKRGILEIKTARIEKSYQWEQWAERIPDYYYAQICHQFLAAGKEYEFAFVFALLTKYTGDCELRTYEFSRSDCESDMEYIQKKEAEFWTRVKTGNAPPLLLPAI